MFLYIFAAHAYYQLKKPKWFCTYELF